MIKDLKNDEIKTITYKLCGSTLNILKNCGKKAKEFNSEWNDNFGITFPQLTGVLAVGFSTFSAFMILMNKYGIEGAPILTNEDIIKRGLIGFTFMMGYTTKMFLDAQRENNEEILFNMVTSKIYYDKLQKN